MHQQLTCTSAPGFETENKISNSGGKEDDQMEDFQDLENKQKKEDPVDQKDTKHVHGRINNIFMIFCFLA